MSVIDEQFLLLLMLMISLCLNILPINNVNADLINNVHHPKDIVIDETSKFDGYNKDNNNNNNNHQIIKNNREHTNLDSSDILYEDYFNSEEELEKFYDDKNDEKRKKILLPLDDGRKRTKKKSNLENDSIEYESHQVGPSLDDDTTSLLPIFLIEPQSTYVVKNKAAVLKCKAAHALKLSFKCSGNSKPPPSKYDSHVDPHSGIHMVEVTASISRDLVEEYFGSGPFRCECYGWSSRGNAKSQSASVEVAYIRKQFATSPTSIQARIGDRIEFNCIPPNGLPVPKVTWYKNGIPIVQNNTPSTITTIGPEETLTIQKISLQDIANYTCAAENIAGKRISEVASLNVYTSIWSPWSEWTSCSEDCIQIRKRKCIINSADNILMGGSSPNEQYQKSLCSGKDFQTTECRGGNCRIGRNDTVWTLYLIMMVIIFLSVVLAIAWIRTSRKNRPNYFDGTAFQSEYLSETHKKMINFHVNPGHRNYENSAMYQEKDNGMVRSVSEHHYDVPNLALNYATVADEMSAKYSYDNAETSSTASDSSYVVTSEPSNNSSTQLREIYKLKSITKMVTNYGNFLSLYGKQIVLYVPNFAVAKQLKDKLTLSILNEEYLQLTTTVSLKNKLSFLSPIVLIESSNELEMHKPIVLKLVHCMFDPNSWNIYVLHCDKSSDEWNQILTVGKETINTPVYVQLEKEFLYIMTEQLGKYLIVGEPKPYETENIAKIMKLLIFGQMNPTKDLCSLRIYIVPNFPHVKCQCEKLEKKLGGTFLGDSKIFQFKLNQNDFKIQLDCQGEWKVLNSMNYQTIPYNHILNNNSILHCEFSLQRIETKYQGIELNIKFSQVNDNEEELFTIFIPQITEISTSSRVKSIEALNSEQLQLCKTIVDINGLNLKEFSEDASKLPKNIKKILCQCLDSPRNDMKDWRLLAKILNFDRYIAYFATKSSPTEQIINLWECKEISNNSNVMYKLNDVLNEINRLDLRETVDKISNNTPLWL